MSHLPGDVFDGIYYFIVVPPGHDPCETERAITAGIKPGDPLTIEPHESPKYQRQQWRVTPVSGDVHRIESVSSPGNWIGFESMEEREFFILSGKERALSIYYHPRRDGHGHYVLKVEQEDETLLVAAAEHPYNFVRNEPSNFLHLVDQA
ncbi:hypothetical protein FRC10_011211 [Ceratobasidium sp. 414]|nr:hypothetical protein FRC10_011211 [Ceratobasidium sp. 414]